jgi:hypothetical protein
VQNVHPQRRVEAQHPAGVFTAPIEIRHRE